MLVSILVKKLKPGILSILKIVRKIKSEDRHNEYSLLIMTLIMYPPTRMCLMILESHLVSSLGENHRSLKKNTTKIL